MTTDDIRLTWQSELPTFTELEWLLQFEDQLKENTKILLNRLNNELNQFDELLAELEEKKKYFKHVEWGIVWFADYAISQLEQEEKAIEREIKKTTWLIQSIGRGKTENKRGITPEQINAARNSPIENYYVGKLNKRGKRAIGLCPFHSEKSPSFIIYLDQNSFWCYSCNTGGDSISFVMKQQGITFPEAVKLMSGT